MNEQPSHHHLERSVSNRVIAGVAGGLGEYFAIDPTIIRIFFVLLALWGGGGVLIYLVLWFIMPSQQSRTGERPLHANADQFAEEVRTVWTSGAARSRLGGWLIVLGVGFLLLNLGLFTLGLIVRFWPLLLILFGLQMLIRPNR